MSLFWWVLKDLLLPRTHNASDGPPQRYIPCYHLNAITQAEVLTTGLILRFLRSTWITLVEQKFPRAGARFIDLPFDLWMPDDFNADVPSTMFTTHRYREPYRSPTRPDIDPLRKSSHSEPLYLVSEQCPQDGDGFVTAENPIFNIHVSIFDDLTLIGITYLNVASDLGGIRTLLHAWTRLVSGESINSIEGMDREAALPRFFQEPTYGILYDMRTVRGYWHEVLPAPLESLKEAYASLELALGLNITARARRWMFPPERRLIRVPKALLNDLRSEILHNLKVNGSTESVDRSDVLLAWWFKTSYANRPVTDTTPISLHISVDLRPSFSTPGTPYINHASSTIFIEPPIPANSFRALPLGELALRIRRAIIEYHADSSTLAFEVWWRTREFPLYRSLPGCEASLQTDWSQARLTGLDFSGARAMGAESKGTGRVTFVVAENLQEELGTGEILMEDEDAVWMSQVQTAKQWEEFRPTEVRVRGTGFVYQSTLTRQHKHSE
ncbi:hypothetical protein C8R46DRAFT_1073934 [Mycena filopes]|nr:hypothetical protein C8R46DRAFT_1073934 [Mycena filopes]